MTSCLRGDCCSVTTSCPTPVTPWTVACQAPLSVGFPKQEYWSELCLLLQGNLSNAGIESTSLALAGGFFTTAPPRKPSRLLSSKTAVKTQGRYYTCLLHQQQITTVCFGSQDYFLTSHYRVVTRFPSWPQAVGHYGWQYHQQDRKLWGDPQSKENSIFKRRMI